MKAKKKTRTTKTGSAKTGAPAKDNVASTLQRIEAQAENAFAHLVLTRDILSEIIDWLTHLQKIGRLLWAIVYFYAAIFIVLCLILWRVW